MLICLDRHFGGPDGLLDGVARRLLTETRVGTAKAAAPTQTGRDAQIAALESQIATLNAENKRRSQRIDELLAAAQASRTAEADRLKRVGVEAGIAMLAASIKMPAKRQRIHTAGAESSQAPTAFVPGLGRSAIRQ